MKDDYPFSDKCEKCIHENVCYMVGECVNYIPDFECDCFEEKRPDGITMTFNVDKIEKFEDASCENCEHAYRGADPLKIIQDSKYLFYCAAGHAYGGSETVCSEWRRKEGDLE